MSVPRAIRGGNSTPEAPKLEVGGQIPLRSRLRVSGYEWIFSLLSGAPMDFLSILKSHNLYTNSSIRATVFLDLGALRLGNGFLTRCKYGNKAKVRRSPQQCPTG